MSTTDPDTDSTAEAEEAPAPAPAYDASKFAILQFPTDTPMSEYASAEVLHASGVDDDAIAKIAELTQAKSINLDGEFTDDGLTPLVAVSGLESLSLNSPNFTGRGLKALDGLASLGSLTIRGADLTPKGVRSITRTFPNLTSLSLHSKSIGLDHLYVLRGLEKLESLWIWGGGDIFGGGDGELDRMSAVEIAVGSPSLKSINASWWNGRSMFGDDTIIAMCEARPDLTVNGTWYAARVFTDPPTPDVEGSEEVAVLDADNFESTISSEATTVVHLTSSNENMCKAFVVGLQATGAGFDQLPGAVGDRARVGRVDEHTTGELMGTIREKYQAGTGQVVVFRGGEIIARLGADSGTRIMAQLRPVL